MKDANQVCKQGFPDTEFEFVHEVDNHHLGNINIFSKSLKKGILYHIWSVRDQSAIEESAHNSGY